MTKEEAKEFLRKALAGPKKMFKTETFAWLAALCEDQETSLELRYHSGWFEKPGGEPYLDESGRGWTVEVGMRSYTNDDGTEAFYGKPSHAVRDGLRLLLSVLEDV